MKIAFIATVFNEEKTIDLLLHSLLAQTKKPDEIIVVDGDSTDRTWDKLQTFQRVNKVRFVVKILQKKGNRSIGRNEAVKIAKSEIIVCSDAGCILDKDWVKNITIPFEKDSVDVVAGYYKAKATTVFQKCLAPYVLVMEDKVDPKTFLPASRSMAFTKAIWEKVGRFPKHLSHNEDYAFAKKLVMQKARIQFARDAIVYWLPRQNISQAFTMFYRFAYGDIQAGILRPKVIFLFARYWLGFWLLYIGITQKQRWYLIILTGLFLLYLLWVIGKNFRYVKSWKAIFLLPMMQLIADLAVLTGSLFGLLSRIFSRKS